MSLSPNSSSKNQQAELEALLTHIRALKQQFSVLSASSGPNSPASANGNNNNNGNNNTNRSHNGSNKNSPVAAANPIPDNNGTGPAAVTSPSSGLSRIDRLLEKALEETEAYREFHNKIRELSDAALNVSSSPSSPVLPASLPQPQPASPPPQIIRSKPLDPRSPNRPVDSKVSPRSAVRSPKHAPHQASLVGDGRPGISQHHNINSSISGSNINGSSDAVVINNSPSIKLPAMVSDATINNNNNTTMSSSAFSFPPDPPNLIQPVFESHSAIPSNRLQPRATHTNTNSGVPALLPQAVQFENLVIEESTPNATSLQQQLQQQQQQHMLQQQQQIQQLQQQQIQQPMVKVEPSLSRATQLRTPFTPQSPHNFFPATFSSSPLVQVALPRPVQSMVPAPLPPSTTIPASASTIPISTTSTTSTSTTTTAAPQRPGIGGGIPQLSPSDITLNGWRQSRPRSPPDKSASTMSLPHPHPSPSPFKPTNTVTNSVNNNSSNNQHSINSNNNNSSHFPAQPSIGFTSPNSITSSSLLNASPIVATSGDVSQTQKLDLVLLLHEQHQLISRVLQHAQDAAGRSSATVKPIATTETRSPTYSEILYQKRLEELQKELAQQQQKLALASSSPPQEEDPKPNEAAATTTTTTATNTTAIVEASPHADVSRNLATKFVAASQVAQAAAETVFGSNFVVDTRLLEFIAEKKLKLLQQLEQTKSSNSLPLDSSKFNELRNEEHEKLANEIRAIREQIKRQEETLKSYRGGSSAATTTATTADDTPSTTTTTASS